MITDRESTPDQLARLATYDHKTVLDLYFRVYNQFVADQELDTQDLATLIAIQKAGRLSNKEVQFEQTIRPYGYVNRIRTRNALPVLNWTTQDRSNPLVLHKGEVIHYLYGATLSEMKTVSLGYKGGSRGFSFRVMKGMYYRTGSHKGHMVKEDRLVLTSAGTLVVTNQRIILHPSKGNKPVSIPLKKVLSYGCYDNGIEVFKEGREKGYFFSVANSGAVEVFGICLGFLLTPHDDLAPVPSSNIKNAQQTTSGSTAVEQSPAVSSSTDLVGLLETLELLRNEVNQLLAPAGYRLGGSGLEGDGDPQKLDVERVKSALSEIQRVLAAISGNLKAKKTISRTSLSRLQELLGKAGINVSDKAAIAIGLADDTHVRELSQAEKDEIRAIFGGGKQKGQAKSNASAPVINVSGVAPCKFCGESNR
ncbi:MAG: hypothetical protein ACXVJJ_06165 [Halobacteriota archaeon]